MKQAVRLIAGLLSVSLVLLGMGTAQDQYTEGPVSRVTLVHILPGHFIDFCINNAIIGVSGAEHLCPD